MNRISTATNITRPPSLPDKTPTRPPGQGNTWMHSHRADVQARRLDNPSVGGVSNGLNHTSDATFLHWGDPAFNQRVLMFLRGQQATNSLLNGGSDYEAPEGPGIDKNLFNHLAMGETKVLILTPVKEHTPQKSIKSPDSTSTTNATNPKASSSKPFTILSAPFLAPPCYSTYL